MNLLAPPSPSSDCQGDPTNPPAGSGPGPATDYGPDCPFSVPHQAGDLLGYLAWGVTAAGVAGLLIVGLQMALQLRRGEMGEGATYFRGGAFVLGACILGVTAGPLVKFVIWPYLLH